MNARLLPTACALSLMLAFLAQPVFAAKSKKPKTPPPPPNTVPGSAFCLFSDLDVAGISLDIGPLPFVQMPATGGTFESTVFEVDLAALGTSATMSAITSGTVGPDLATVDSIALIEGLDLLHGLVTADVVAAFSTSVGDGTSARSSSVGTTLVGLKIAGVSIGNVTPPPNTVIPIPLVGVLVLNEQVKAGDGVKTSALTVTVAHLILDHELKDPDFVEHCINLGILDLDLIESLLDGTLLDLDLLHELRLLGIVDHGLINLVVALLGGVIELDHLEDLLDIDLVDQLIGFGKLDLLLEKKLGHGLLTLELLEVLFDEGLLEGVLEDCLFELDILDGGFLDLSFLEFLIGDDFLDLDLLKHFLGGHGHREDEFTLIGGELILCSAHSGVAFFGATRPTGQNFLLHGGGKLGDGHDAAHFGMHVHVPKKKKKGLHGHLHYHDHLTGLKIHSHTLTSATVDIATKTVTFTGIAEVNGVGGYTFTAIGRDVAKHGTGNDTFSITLQGPPGYERSGTLTAGNFHLHLGK